MNARQYSLSFNPQNAQVELGSHPIGRQIAGLLLSTKPIMYLYMPSLQLILYEGDRLYLNVLKKLLEQGMRLPMESVRQ